MASDSEMLIRDPEAKDEKSPASPSVTKTVKPARTPSAKAKPKAAALAAKPAATPAVQKAVPSAKPVARKVAAAAKPKIAAKAESPALVAVQAPPAKAAKTAPKPDVKAAAPASKPVPEAAAPKPAAPKTPPKAETTAPVAGKGADFGEPSVIPSLLDALNSVGAGSPCSPMAQMANQLWMLNPLHKVLPLDWTAITDSLLTVAGRASVEPDRTKERLSALSTRMMQEASDIWVDWMSMWLGKNVSKQPAKAPEKSGDSRFDSQEWKQNPVFRQMAKSYQAVSDYLVDEAERADLDPEERRRLVFNIRQLVDATSPNLFLMTNPVALKKAFETGGASIAEGWRNLLADIEAGSLSMTDVEAFLPGRNLALTPGKVVFRNRLIELIQYAPATEQTKSLPIMFVPPWINKFYILDLQPKNSMVRYLVEQGYTVFMISWKNPDASMEEMTFEDYMREGPLAASDAVREITGQKQLNAVGYCIGGTLLVSTLAALAAKGDNRFNAVTLMVSLQDFTEVGDTKVFFDEPSIAFMENQMLERGYLDSKHMSNMFNLLRANDLIWSTVVNNYLLGNRPPAFDLLYWNADGTRMTRAAHSFYLRNTYLENNLVKPGKLTLLGEKIDLGKIKQDIYAVGAEKDHIVPWRTAWRISQLAGGNVRYVLAASGHIAGIINPPAKAKGCYWTTETPVSAPNAEAWLKKTEQTEGSWWTNWEKWLSARSGEMGPPPAVGSAKYQPLCDSPGTYVLER